MKDEDTLRERYPFSRFKEVALEMVAKWSKEYTTNIKKYSQETTITLNLCTKGYHCEPERPPGFMSCHSTKTFFISLVLVYIDH